MWGNYGRILSEYIYLKQFRKNNLNQFIEIEGLDYLNEIKKNNKQVVFISGHFNNFELNGNGNRKSRNKFVCNL